MKLFDKTLTHVERALDLRLARQNVLASNLANVDTPGFTPKDVDFARSFAAATSGAGNAAALPAQAATDARHIPVDTSAGAANLTLVQSAASVSPGLDGNGVDLDRTMTDLAQNALQYGAAARAASRKLALLRLVASDGQG